jgi:2-polyprenyl-6-methoxyphenol hydroxylase-like FAD-dependent oxidoreductase
MADTQTFSVIIVGAGPVGLALALALTHHGVRSLVLEKKPALSAHSKALGLLPRTLEIFQQWGILGPFLDAGQFLSRVSVWAVGRPSPPATLDLSSLARVSAVPGVLILPQDRTEALLLEQVRAQGRTEVRFGHEVRGFRQDEAGVIVQVASQKGSVHELRASYLVGCDGPHSRVREQFGWPLAGKTYPTRMLLADVRLDDERDDLPWPRVAPQPRGVLAALRYQPRHWRIISTLAPGESEADAAGDRAITGRVERLFGPGPFERVWASTFRIHCRTSPHFRQGHALLAGDAAHINSPVGGQGMNSGIQDAHNLAWKLARALHDGDGVTSEALLASYELERRGAVTGSVDRITDFLTRFVLLPGPLIRVPFVVLAGLALSRPALRHRILLRLGMLDTRYPSSPLISGTGALLGARAPDGELMAADANGDSPRRLFDLVDRQAILLLFDDGRLPGWDPAPVRARLADVPGLTVARLVPITAKRKSSLSSDTFRDAGQLWRAWRARAGDAALIRPDGYVGWRARRPTPDALRAGVTRALGRSAAFPASPDPA